MPAKKAPAKKAPARKKADPVAAVAAEIAESPAVQDRLDRIGMIVLENIEYTLMHGSEAQRDSLTDRLFKNILAAQGKEGNSGIDEKERAEFRKMMAAMGKAISE